MTDLESFDCPTPRPIDVCRRYAGRIDGGWLFLMALVIIPAGATIGMVVGLELGRPPGGLPLLLAAGGGLGVAGYLGWRARRRRASHRLLSGGVLYEMIRAERGTLATAAGVMAGGFHPDSIVKLVLDSDGTTAEMLVRFGPLFPIEVGERCRVLHLADYSRCAAFDRSGRLHAGLVILPLAS